MFSYLIWDNQKSLSSIHKLRNHKLQQHSIPIKTVHSKHELIDLINSIDDNQYLIIDSGGFDSLYTRLAILGCWYLNYSSPNWLGLKTYLETFFGFFGLLGFIEFPTFGIKLLLPLKLRPEIIFPCYCSFFIEIHHSWLRIPLILILFCLI